MSDVPPADFPISPIADKNSALLTDVGDRDCLRIDAYRPESLNSIDQIGKYRIKNAGDTQIQIVKGSMLMRSTVAVGSGVLFVSLMFACAIPGNAGRMALYSIAPAMVIVAIICCWVPRRIVRIDFGRNEVQVIRASLTQQWQANEFYAVYIDSASPQTGKLRVLLAERNPTSAVGGVIMAACGCVGHDGQMLLNLAAAIACKLKLPLKASEDARTASTLAPKLLVVQQSEAIRVS